MAYNSISIKPYIKSHLELQREITLIELAPSPYFFVLSICLAYINMFAGFDENPSMTLQDIKETKRYGRTHARTDGSTDGQRENSTPTTSIPTTNKVCGGWGIKTTNLYIGSWVIMAFINLPSQRAGLSLTSSIAMSTP